MYRLVQEIKSILTYTNATPFKTKVTQYCCAYCTQGIFNDAVELRNHTRQEHMDERTKKVDIMMRPHWQNEILKLDIDNLLCVACCVPLFNWQGLLSHLTEEHKVHFEWTYKHIIPFQLKPEHECALCQQTFINYLQLDGHMNSHYDNYVCCDCGDTFLTLPRLKSHAKIHTVGKFPCRFCPKLFTVKLYRRKHEDLVHKEANYYKCAHCPQKFNNETDKKKHTLSLHADQMKEYTCELCGKTTNWQKSFHDHMRKAHGNKKHECSVCQKKFYNKSDLVTHMKRHSDGRKYACSLCGRVCITQAALTSHMRVHQNSVIFFE